MQFIHNKSFRNARIVLAQRINFIQSLLDRNNTNIAFRLIDRLLKTDRLRSSYGFSFGANVRDYGYVPRSLQNTRRGIRNGLIFFGS